MYVYCPIKAPIDVEIEARPKFWKTNFGATCELCEEDRLILVAKLMANSGVCDSPLDGCEGIAGVRTSGGPISWAADKTTLGRGQSAN